MDKRLKLGIFLLLSGVISIAFTFVVFQTRFGNVQAQGTTCTPKDPIGAYCQRDGNFFLRRITSSCVAEDYISSTCRLDDLALSGPQCNVGGNERKCSNVGMICDCSTSCVILNSLPDGAACCNNNSCQSNTCNNGVCGVAFGPTPTFTGTPPVATGSGQAPPAGSSLPWGYTPYRPQFGDLLKQLAFIAPLFLAIYWLF